MPHNATVIFLLTCLSFSASEPLAAADPKTDSDWPTWRGPQRNGICLETGLLQEWTQQGPPLVWQTEGLGGGYSSIAVADGRIYTMGRRRRPQSGTFLIALDSKTGRELWSTPCGQGNPNCTPSVGNGMVYALGREGTLICVNAQTGKQVWSTHFPREFGGKMMSGWGYSESPLLDGDRLICTPGAKTAAIAALDSKTGHTIWTTSVSDLGNRGRDGAGYSSIVVSRGGGVRQYVQMTGRGIISVAADSGKLLWNYNRIANGTANIPTPVISGNYVFCSTGYGTGSALLKVQPGAQGIEEMYFLGSKDLQNHHGGMILVDDYLYCGHGHNKGLPLCIDLKTGKSQWGPERGPGSGSAAILYADDHLYFRYENGVVALIEATPDSYKLKGSFRMATNNGKSWPHPVIHNGRLYLRDQDALLCYNVRAR